MIIATLTALLLSNFAEQQPLFPYGYLRESHHFMLTRPDVLVRPLSAPEYLSVLHFKAVDGGQSSHVVTLSDPIDVTEWITSGHAHVLFTLIDDERPAAHVVSLYSSRIPSGASSVGHQACYLLEGLRRGQYPFATSSDRYTADRDALRAWWAEQEAAR